MHPNLGNVITISNTVEHQQHLTQSLFKSWCQTLQSEKEPCLWFRRDDEGPTLRIVDKLELKSNFQFGIFPGCGANEKKLKHSRYSF